MQIQQQPTPAKAHTATTTRQAATAKPSGKPPQPDVGGTAETIAKQMADPLIMLEHMKLITRAQGKAGLAIIGQWRAIVPPSVAGTTRGGGREPDPDDIEQAEETYRLWCWAMDGRPSELFRRCMVSPAKVVEWMTDQEGIARTFDFNEKGALGVLKRALDWWIEAAQQTAKRRAARQRAQQQAA